MSWLRAAEGDRALASVERRRLEPAVAARGALGLALVVGVSLALFGPFAVAASSARSARSRRPSRPSSARTALPHPRTGLRAEPRRLDLPRLSHRRPRGPLPHPARSVDLPGGPAWPGPSVPPSASSPPPTWRSCWSPSPPAAHLRGYCRRPRGDDRRRRSCAGRADRRPARAPLGRPARRALADALAAVADYARRLRHDPTAPSTRHADDRPQRRRRHPAPGPPPPRRTTRRAAR